MRRFAPAAVASIGAAAFLFSLLFPSCSSEIPEPKLKKYSFPKNEAFIEEVKRPHHVLGRVRTEVTYPTLDFHHSEDRLCANYFNKAVKDLVARARKAGGDAVIEVRSVVFYEDGTQEVFKKAECSDDGEEGEVLATGLVVQWDPEPSPSPSPSPDLSHPSRAK